MPVHPKDPIRVGIWGFAGWRWLTCEPPVRDHASPEYRLHKPRRTRPFQRPTDLLCRCALVRLRITQSEDGGYRRRITQSAGSSHRSGPAEEGTVTPLHPGVPSRLGGDLAVPRWMAGPCSVDEAGHGEALAQRGLPALVAVEVPEARPSVAGAGDAGSDPQAESGEPALGGRQFRALGNRRTSSASSEPFAGSCSIT